MTKDGEAETVGELVNILQALDPALPVASSTETTPARSRRRSRLTCAVWWRNARGRREATMQRSTVRKR